jgi:hypothetical protein
MKMLLAASLLSASSAHAALDVAPPKPGGLFGHSPRQAVPYKPHERATGPWIPPFRCDAGKFLIWTNPHDQGFIYFDDGLAVWTREEVSLPYAFLGSGGTSGVATRLTAKPNEPRGIFLRFVTVTALHKGKPQDLPILIWDDYVFYPECRELAPS